MPFMASRLSSALKVSLLVKTSILSKEILTAGWDYSDSEGYVEHFYSENKRRKLINPANKPYFGENAESIKNSAKVNKYFKSKGVSLKCIQSPNCFLDSSIERVVL